jgi:hypothetical protein
LTIRDRLENWREAARWGAGGYGGSCIGSLEGRYRPERPKDDPDAPPRRVRPDPDFDDAEVINAAWLRLPRREKFFLKFLYIDNAAIAFICRKFNIRQRPASCFELERVRIEKFIESVVVNRKNVAHNVPTI